MTSLSGAKAIGGVGAILLLLSFIPTGGSVFGVAGFIMILIAVKYISDILGSREIFRSMITAVIFSIAAIVVASVVVTGTMLNAFQNGYFTGTDPMSPAPGVTPGQWLAFAAMIAIGLVAAWILFMISAVYLRRSYYAIDAGLDVHTFHTAGLLYFIGAALSIIMVGFVILLVAEIVTAVAFFSIPERVPEKLRGTPAAVPPS